MKLLMIGPTPEPYTGQSVSFKRLKESFELEKGVTVYHVETAPKSKSSHKTGQVSLSRVMDTTRILLSFLYFVLFVRPDVVYLTKGSTNFGFVRDYAMLIFMQVSLCRAKFVVHLKGGNYDIFYEKAPRILKHQIRFFLNRVDKIIVLGESLIEMYDFFPEISSKIVVVKNGCPDEVPQFEKKYPSVVTFLYLSNLIYSKGYLDVCKAALELERRGVTNIKVLFAGDFMASPDDPAGERVATCKATFFQYLRDLPCLDYVGRVSGNKKSQLLRQAQVAVLPTNYHVEGQPVSIVEAMGYSCAIISTKFRSIPDLVDETNCIFVPYGEVTKLADAMQKFTECSEKVKQMSESSKKLFEYEHSWAAHFSKMKQVISVD